MKPQAPHQNKQSAEKSLLEASLAVPTRANINELRDRFGEIQREENIDIDLIVARP